MPNITEIAPPINLLAGSGPVRTHCQKILYRQHQSTKGWT